MHSDSHKYPDTLLPVAQVLKSYGTDGEILISFFPEMPDEINLDEPIFLYYEGLSVPFFINSFVRKGSNRALLKLEDIESLDEAEEIVGRKIFLPEEQCYNTDSEDDEYSEALTFVGHTLYNQEGKKIGIITSISNFSGNICLEIGDSLFPFHKELIISSDTKNKRLTLTIAEGL